MTTAAKSEQGHFLNVNDYKKMILWANYFFEHEKERINALNVFPVPDGDTGTNMSMTLQAAAKGSLAYKGNSIGELSEIVASKALMGARGNSGVILSQILRGLARGLRKKEKITPGELSKAFQYAVVYAYRAVSKPVEGTILTVARETARGIRAAVKKGENLYDSMEAAIKSGKTALAKTTEMLPALKEANVVDAGGLGFLVFLEGCLYAMKKSINDIVPQVGFFDGNLHFTGKISPETNIKTRENFSLEFPYCTEIIVKNKEGKFSGLREKLLSLGDSLLVATDNNLAKIHIHTANPGLILQVALDFGTLHDIKIENMADQNEAISIPEKDPEPTFILPVTIEHPKSEIGLISVSFGDGFREIFLSLGTDEVVYGGQTMNPNVEDLLRAVDKLPQQKAIILPNNKNIIMVADQVKNITSKEVEVLETRTLPEGIAALLSFKPDETFEDNVSSMRLSIGEVATGLVTYATRDTILKGRSIKAGQYLGLEGDDIRTAGSELSRTALELLDAIASEDHEIITIFHGQEVPHKEALALSEILTAKYADKEIELQYGGQPIYYYIFSLE